jgi:divalent metal cation (Fe/Co/Zn/Cd) transporter
VDGSARVVYAALAGNVAIAAAKFGAFGISGSSAMLTEAIHSLVDSADQILLLVGRSRARRPPDPDHPLGHGMESYFWSLIVAVMVLLLVMADINRLLSADARIEQVVDIATLHLGPKSVLVALTPSFTSEMTLTDLRHAIHDLTIALKKADARIAYVYVRPAPDAESTTSV